MRATLLPMWPALMHHFPGLTPLTVDRFSGAEINRCIDFLNEMRWANRG